MACTEEWLCTAKDSTLFEPRLKEWVWLAIYASSRGDVND